MLKHETVLEGRYVQVGAGRVHYLETGPRDGRAVVLLHGLASVGQEMFMPLGERLAGRGYRVLALDRPGYGFSDPLPGKRVRPRQQAQLLKGALDAVGAGSPILVAHSAGAAPAVAMAADPRRRPRGMVLINPFSRPTRPAAAPLLRLATAPGIGRPFRRRVMPMILPMVGREMVKAASSPDPAPASLEAFPVRHIADGAAMPAMAAELWGFNGDMAATRTALRRTTTPTVIIAGAGDKVIDVGAHVRWLAHRLPNAEVRWRRNGHMLHHLNPLAVVEAVEAVDGRA